MAGPNLEVFKFGFYMFFPIFIMYKFGDPVWYSSYVLPYKEIIWPPYESTHKPPRSSSELHEELAKLKAKRLGKNENPVNPTPIDSTNTIPKSQVRAEADRLAGTTEAARSPEGSGSIRWDWVQNASKRLV